MDEGRDYFGLFFRWCNTEHRHACIAYLPPACVHDGQADLPLHARQSLLDTHFDAHPERFTRGPPQVPRLPVEVWINRLDEKHLQMTNVEDKT